MKFSINRRIFNDSGFSGPYTLLKILRAQGKGSDLRVVNSCLRDCTPGFGVSLFAECHRPGRTGPCEPHSMRATPASREIPAPAAVGAPTS